MTIENNDHRLSTDTVSADPSGESWRTFFVPGARQREMRSRTGRAYRIFLFVPALQPPAEGFPVLYMLDGNAVFATAAEAMRVQCRRPEKTGVAPAIIVGIGYPTEAPFGNERFYDFTTPAPVSELPLRPDGTEWPEIGGAETFLAFIEEELKPVIERECAVDRSRQAIFGHSLGGLFTLQVLLQKPELFRTYIAGSPSIHWNKRVVLQKEERFVSRLKEEPRNLGILFGAGELELGHALKIVEGVKELTERLAVLSEFGLRAEYKEFEGEGHVSVLPGLISRALRFLTEESKR